MANMATIYNIVYPDELKIPVTGIQTLIDSCRERQRTGLIRLAYSSDEHLYLFFKRGKALTYSLVNSGNERALTQEQWYEKMNSRGDVYSKFISLTPFGVFLSRLLLQAQGAKTEVFSKPKQLTEYFELKTREKEPSLVHVNWQHAAGVVFFPGNRGTPHSVYVSQGSVLDEPRITKTAHELNGSQCSVSTFSPDSSVDAWQEYGLRRLFADVSGPMLERFEALTGRALVESLMRLMTVFASEQNLDIAISSRKLVDREVFTSPQSAAQNYRLYLNEMFGHCSVVIGPRLLASTLREIVRKLTQYEQGMIRTYGLLPGGYFYE